MTHQRKYTVSWPRGILKKIITRTKSDKKILQEKKTLFGGKNLLTQNFIITLRGVFYAFIPSIVFRLFLDDFYSFFFVQIFFFLFLDVSS